MNRKNSEKRQAILKLLRSVKDHPSAEWIFTRLKPAYPNLSLGTVYRNLGVFREEGLVTSVGTVAGQERFDADVRDHPHFVCDSCGRIIDMAIPFLDDKLLDDFGCSAGVKITGYSLYFRGLCEECLLSIGHKSDKKKLF